MLKLNERLSLNVHRVCNIQCGVIKREADTIPTDSVPTDAIPTVRSHDDPVHL